MAFDLLLSGDDIRRRPLIERKNALKWVLRKAREGIQYTATNSSPPFAILVLKASSPSGSHRFINPVRRRMDQSEKSEVAAATRAKDGDFLTSAIEIKELGPANYVDPQKKEEVNMGFGRGALLWLLGIPLPIIILLALFWHH